MSILITGGNGYIARSLERGLDRGDITTISREDFDLTSKRETELWFKDKNFDTVIHTAVKGGSRLTPETDEITYQNLSMFYNILDCKNSYKRLIHFGSGAEQYSPSSPYGISKRVIDDILKLYKQYANLRIYGVFDENELGTRFIKANILNYINKNPIEIHKDKYMDFFHMDDLVTVVKLFLGGQLISEDKAVDCTYNIKYKLSDISALINNLDTYKVDININDSDGLDSPYISNYNFKFNCKLKGIEKGIYETYLALKNSECIIK